SQTLIVPTPSSKHGLDGGLAISVALPPTESVSLLLESRAGGLIVPVTIKALAGGSTVTTAVVNVGGPTSATLNGAKIDQVEIGFEKGSKGIALLQFCFSTTPARSLIQAG